MKKLATLAVLPVIALASCSKTEEKPELQTETQTTSENNLEDTQMDSTNENVETEANTGTQDTQALNSEITSTVTDTQTGVEEKAFDFTYEIGGNTVPVKGKFTINQGVITAMTFDGINLEDKSPLASFAKNAPAQIIGKEVKGLQIDTVSGASYVTKGFNDYMKTFN